MRRNTEVRAMQKSKGRNLSYNALRGLAALGIFFSHMSYLKASDLPFWSDFYQIFMAHGSVCSSFFYVLSGFLAVYTWRNLGFKDYAVRKLKKLYPLVFCVFLLAAAFDLFMSGSSVINDGVAPLSGQWWFNVLMNLTMLKAFVPFESTFYSFHGPSWYMSALIVFYILAWFIVPKLVDEKSKKTAVRWVTAVCIAAYAVQAVICFIVDINGLSDIRLWITYVNPWFRIFGECFLGMAVACHIDNIKMAANSGGILKTAALLFALAVLLLRNVFSTSLWNAWIYVFPITLVLIAFYNDQGGVANALKAKPLQVLGNISFELYMTHAFVYEGLPIAVGILSASLKSWIVYHAGIRFIITMILAILFAWIVNKLFGLIGRKKKRVKA